MYTVVASKATGADRAAACENVRERENPSCARKGSPIVGRGGNGHLPWS
jgi:hypothetical protein